MEIRTTSLLKMKELQEVLYSYPIDKEKLIKQIGKLQSIVSNEEIDHELIFAFSLDYRKIPFLIPFLSKKSIDKNQFVHYDQDFLTILLKNGIDFPAEDLLGLKNRDHRMVEEELVMELEKKRIEFDKTKITIRKKSQLEKAIKEDDVETLRLLSNQTNFDLNQEIEKENQLYEYSKIPIILFCIENHAMKCFKFLLINGANPLKTISSLLPPFEKWGYFKSSWKDTINGMTFGAETGNLQIMQMIEEKGGKIDENCIYGAAKFHQNHILKWILQTNQNQDDMIDGLCSSAGHNNFEGISLFLERGIDINAHEFSDEKQNLRNTFK